VPHGGHVALSVTLFFFLIFGDVLWQQADHDAILSNWKHLTEGVSQPDVDSADALPIGYMLGL
jgi:hypothetical protein